MQRVEGAEVALDCQPGGMLDESLIHIDHAECWPFFSDRLDGCRPGCERDGSEGLDEPDPAHEPALRLGHRSAQGHTPRLGHVTLDQRARVQVEVQFSRSLSARTSSDADRVAMASFGGFPGRSRVGRTSRPSATRRRRLSSAEAAPAGTMSATGLPRRVTRTCSPRPTARNVWLRDCLRSRMPTTLMWTHYHEESTLPKTLASFAERQRRERVADPRGPQTCASGFNQPWPPEPPSRRIGPGFRLRSQ